MRTSSFTALIALALLSGSLCSFANAQVKESELEEARKAFKEAFEEQDQVKKYEKAKAFFTRFPTADDEVICCDWVRNLRRFVERYEGTSEIRRIYSKCQEADKSFLASPTADTLTKAIDTCDVWLKRSPKPDVYYTTRLALATGYGVITGFDKDTNRSFSYAEEALKLLAPEKPPEGWKPEDWQSFRRNNIGRLLQYQGLYKLRQEKPEAEVAISYLTKAAEFQDGPAFKDINTYSLRVEATSILYKNRSAEYNNLSASERVDVKGNELTAQLARITDNLAHDSARIVVLIESRNIHIPIADAKAQLNQFCRQREACVASFIRLSKKEFGIR